MSEDAIIATKPGKGGKLLLIIPIALVMSGAGIAGGLYASGAFGGGEEELAKEDPNKPQLVMKGEDPTSVAEKAIAEGGGAAGGGEGHGESKMASLPHVETKIKLPKGGVELPHPKDVSKYQATYYQMSAPYTSNLADTDSLVQVALAVSTYYDSRVIDAIKVHDLAIRSEILLMLSQQSELELSTPEGKEALQKRLTGLINKILREKTGYSGVDNVYFTNFIVQ